MEKAKTKILEIFSGTFEHESAAAIEQYLDEACRDQVEIRQEVEELLLSHREAGCFLGGTSPIDGIGSRENPVDLSGTIVGPYKLLEPLGEGGMGTVYMAQQNEPVKRRVAIKLIKPGMDSQQVLARFEAERQALAVMDHPNIAKVFDAGTTESGRPYFVMELVKGLPFNQFCDEQELTTEARLKLFRLVCNAVQHAHQKGIIHRDLKPSNILIAMYDDQQVPKVIDFGVAKATHESLTEKSFFTRFGQVVGTLEYMSPEQAQFNQLDVDTRSDIYSLGAILYELLSGEPPFERERLKSQAFDETLRMIREEEPTKPSTKLRLAASSGQTAAKRRTTTEKLTSIVRGDLDWIVIKALEKDRSRRYETANALGLDIQRYLDNETVSASSPSSLYKFRKFSRRNRGAIVSGILIVATLIVGTGSSVWQANRATIAQKQAEDERQIADENFRLTLDSLKTAYSVAEHLDEVPVLEPWHREVLNDAFENCRRVIGRLEEQPEFGDDLMELLVIAGRIHYRMDRLQSAAELLSRAIEIGEDPKYENGNATRTVLATAYDQMAAVHGALGPSDGLSELQKANLIWAAEVLNPDVGSDQVFRLAKNYLMMANALHGNGDYNLALQLMEKTLQECDDWLASHDDRNVREVRVEALVDLAHALDVGERDRAIELAQEGYDLATSLELKPEVVAGSARALADLLCDSRETVVQAERLFDQSRELRAQLASDYPNHIPHLAKYSRSLLRLSQFKMRLGKNTESKKLLTEAVQIHEDVASKQDDHIGVLDQLANLYMARGQAAWSLGKLDEAVQYFTDELQLREELRSRRDDVSARINVAAALTRIAKRHLQAAQSEPRTQNAKKGEALLCRANEVLSTISKIDENQSLHGLLGTIAEGLARSLNFQGRDTEAESAIKQAIKYHELDSAHNSQELRQLAGDLSNHAWIIGGSQEKDNAKLNSAKQMCLIAIELQEQAISLAISDAEKDRCVVFLSNHYFILGDLQFELSEFRESLACFDRSAKLNPNQAPQRTAWFSEVYLEHVPEELRDAKRAEHMARLALKQNPDFHNAQVWLGVALFRQEKFVEAGHQLVKTIEKSPNDLHTQAVLGMAQYRLDDFDQANELLQKSHRHSTETALYLVMAVVRSEKDIPDANVTKANVEEFFKEVVENSKKESNRPELIKELIDEVTAVVSELPVSSRPTAVIPSKLASAHQLCIASRKSLSGALLFKYQTCPLRFDLLPKFGG